MTEQGGDIDLFSANGNISAGEGPKTYVSDPPISLVCDNTGYCFVNPTGLVSGAGIGALITLPGQDPSKSNVSLVAPHGTVDAGAAGIRVAGDINIVALQVLNAFNVQVGGTTTGIPTVQGPPVAALTSAGNTAGAAQHPQLPGQSNDSKQPSVVIVEVIGYGGGEDSEPVQPDESKQRKSGPERRSQDPENRVQVLDVGELTATQRRELVEEKRNLAGRP